MEAFLSAGVALSILDNTPLFKFALNSGRAPLPKAKEMQRLIPEVHAKELDLVQSELQGKYVSVVYDGTTSSVGEIIVLVIRYCMLLRAGLIVNEVTAAEHEDASSYACLLHARFVVGDESGRPIVTQRLVSLDIFAQSFNANLLGGHICRVLSSYGLMAPAAVDRSKKGNWNDSRVLSVIKDGASVNEACWNILRVLLPRSIGLTCLSHRLNL